MLVRCLRALLRRCSTVGCTLLAATVICFGADDVAADFPGNKYFEWKGARHYFCETTDRSVRFTVGEVPPSVNLDNYTQRIEVAPQLLPTPSNP